MTGDDVRVYTEGGTVAHFIDGLLSSPNDVEQEAFCGRTSWPGLWFGTGSQEEEDSAAKLRLCAKCQTIQNHRKSRIFGATANGAGSK